MVPHNLIQRFEMVLSLPLLALCLATNLGEGKKSAEARASHRISVNVDSQCDVAGLCSSLLCLSGDKLVTNQFVVP